MKYSKIALITAAALALSACGSDDNNSSPAPVEARNAVMSIVTTKIDDIKGMNSRGNVLAAQKSTTDYEHALHTTGYKVIIEDGDNVDNLLTDVDITKPLSLSLYGAATITIKHPIHGDAVAYKVDGSTTVGAEDTEFSITVSNTKYEYVSIAKSNDLMSAPSLTSFIPVEMTEVTVPAETGSDLSETGYYYGYVAAESTMEMDTSQGFQSVTIPYTANKHVKFSIDWDENGSIIITDPDFVDDGNDIIIGEPQVIVASQVDFAEFVSEDAATKAVTYRVSSDNLEPQIYPKFKVAKDTILSDYNWTEVEMTTTSTTPFMSIYLEDSQVGNFNYRATYYLDGRATPVSVWNDKTAPEKDVKIGDFTVVEFKSIYGSAKVRQYLDNLWTGRVNTNFIIRTMDANTDTEATFTVSKYNVTTK